MKILKKTNILLIIIFSILLSAVFCFKAVIIQSLLVHINFSAIDTETVRKLATGVLDAASIPDGDISISSNKAYSGRYVISKWQRGAIGSSVVIFGKDRSGNLAVLLGKQRGLLRNPQGYMEIPLPKVDLTGLKEQHASRVNNKGEPVMEDRSLEDNAVREVYEETGLKIKKSDLILLGVTSNVTDDPICFAIQYMITLDNTPVLSSHDDEFVEDDLHHPIWVKLSDIKYNSNNESYFSQAHNITLDEPTVRIMNLGLKKLNIPEIRPE